MKITALAQLVRLYAECRGVTSTAKLAELTGYSERSIWKAKAELRDSEAGCTLNPSSVNHSSVHPEPECTNPEPECSPLAGASCAQELFEEIITPIPPQKPEPLPIDEALELWQQLAAEKGLPRVERFTKERKQKLSARLREVGLEGWEKAINAIRGSKFHCGQNDRNWRATFDFVVRSENKVAELIERGNANGSHRKLTDEQLANMTQADVIRMMRAH